MKEEKEMKKLLVLVIGFMLIGVNLYAADGDLIVNNRAGIGATNPEQKVHAYTSGADNHILSDVPTGNTYDPLFTLRIQGETVWNMGIDASDSNKFKIANGGSWNNLSAGARLTINNSNGYVGIGTSTPGANLEINGPGSNTLRIRATGSPNYWDIFQNYAGADNAFTYLYNGGVVAKVLTTGAWQQLSDSDLKENISPLENPIEKIKAISGIKFTWKNTELSADEQVGVLAQEVEQVLPQAVSTNDEGNKMISYASLIPLLIEAVKEQQKTIEALKADLAAIKK